jgi:hypothetical protein
MNNEFKKLTQNNVTRYILESGDSGGATVGGTGAGSISSFEKPMGGIQRRAGDDLIHQENKKSYKVSHKPKNPVAKAHQTVGTGSGAHTDKTKTLPRKEKHKKPADMTMENFNAEYDDEAGMSYGSLHTINRAANGLLDTIKEGDDLPEWCQEKISLAENYLVTVWDYLLSEKQGDVKHKKPFMEGVNHPALQGWDEMDQRQKRDALQAAGIVDSYNTLNKTPSQLDDILHAARVKAQNQEDELGMGASGRRELQRQAKQDFEEQRQQLHKEKMEMERFAWDKANTEAERKHEMAKIDKQYTQELRTLQMSHMQDMEKILHADTHELNKMKAEFNMRQAEREKAKPEPELQDEPENNYGDNFDQDTGEPIRPNNPQQSNQWHTNQQVGYTPAKPSKKDDDVVDVEPKPPKPNKPLAIKEKITVVKDPAKATGIQQTGGVTHGSVYAGKPLPQSLRQKLEPTDSSAPVRAVDANGRTQQQWVKLVKAKFPDAKIMQSKMLDGPCFAMLADGRKLSWNKVEQGVAEANFLGQPGGIPAEYNKAQGNVSDDRTKIKCPYCHTASPKLSFGRDGECPVCDNPLPAGLGQKALAPKPVTNQGVAEEWSQKYKSSINCSHPKGFSQKAHCAGKKKHNESMMTMEMVCEDCGMCETHGNLNEIKKGAKDSNGFTKCWPNHHAVGTKKGKNGGQVRDCRPNEGADSYMESLASTLAEKLDPNAEPEVWVQDFQKANPNKYHQFKNKTPQKKAQMAVAARRDARLKK